MLPANLPATWVAVCSNSQTLTVAGGKRHAGSNTLLLREDQCPTNDKEAGP